MNLLLLIPVILSFFVTFLFVPSWIRRAKRAGLEGVDINKHDKPRVAEAGGIIVVAGFVVGVMCYVAIKTFYLKSQSSLIEIFVLISSILMVALIGTIDDILGWKNGFGKRIRWKIGLSKKTRLLLVLIAAIPLIVINAGHSKINIPLFGVVDIGILYPLLIIPLGVVGASTTFNFLAGYNGLETGQSILLVGALSIVAYFGGNSWLALIGLCMVGALGAFYLFNSFPAKIFGGDTLTYSVGALIAILAILGNFEKIALFFFIPYVVEVGLKLRGKLKKESFSKPNPDNSLEMPYKKFYGLEHIAIWFLQKVKKDHKATEKELTYVIFGLEIIFILLGLLIFRKTIF